MQLAQATVARRSEDVIRNEQVEWSRCRELVQSLRGTILSGERAAFAEYEKRVETHLAVLALEQSFLGELDLGALLSTRRKGPAPRWFLYSPFANLDQVVWMNTPIITFGLYREGAFLERKVTPFPNPLPQKEMYWARPILLPDRVRTKVRALRDQGLTSYVLFEPKEMFRHTSAFPKLQKPDPALIVEASGKWYVADLWDDPDTEDPRAMNMLREFYTGPRPSA